VPLTQPLTPVRQPNFGPVEGVAKEGRRPEGRGVRVPALVPVGCRRAKVDLVRAEGLLPPHTPSKEAILISKNGGPEGSRTPDLLNAIQTVDRPPESTRVVFEFRTDILVVD
jgi:hypothetical protein